MEDKEIHIANLMQRVNELEKLNTDLSNQLEDKLNTIQNLKTDINNKNFKFEAEINSLQDDNIKIRRSCDDKIIEMEKTYDEAKRKMISDYEKKIEDYDKQLVNMKERYTKLFDDKDKDINSILNNQDDERQSYQLEMGRLREEIQCHKQNILASKFNI